MKTDLIIGMANGYTWQDLEPFAVSLLLSGYKGRCVLLTGKGPQDEVPRYGELPPARTDRTLEHMLSRHKIELVNVGEFSEHPSIARQFFIAEFLKIWAGKLRYVICVDTKDVVFQYDPTEWLEKNLGSKEIAVYSEGQTYGYGDMVGNNKNMVEAFGEDAYKSVKGMFIANGGVFGGVAETIERLTRANFHLALTDRRRATFTPSYKDMLPDQSSLNLLIRQEPFQSATMMTWPSDGFSFGHPLTGCSQFKEGVMVNAHTQRPYAIFHQYFDKPEWWTVVRSKYRG